MTNFLHFRHALLPSGWTENIRLGIASGLITSLVANVEPGPADETHHIALPGLPNLHSHSFQRAIAGLTESRGPGTDSFWSWRELMYRFALTMSPDDVEAVATHAFIEMLEAGFTTVGEFHYLHHAPDGRPYANIAEMAERIAAAAATAGIGLTLLPVFYAHAGFGGQPPAAAQRRFITSLGQFETLHERCQSLAPTGIAPHSLRAVTPDELHALIILAKSAPLHIHIAEQMQEVADCLAWSGSPPITWLLNHADIAANWCLVHATHATAAERAGIAASNAVIGLCPLTEANLGDGIFPAHHYKGGFGIGSDSNVLISVAEELRQLEYSQRLLRRQRNVLSSETNAATATAIYQRGVSGGAQALGLSHAGLQTGAPADLVSLAPLAETPETALNIAVFASRASAVETVWTGGRKRVADGRHPAAAQAREAFAAVVKRLM